MIEKFLVGMVKSECGQSGVWALKLAVSQERSDGTNWFFAGWYNITQIKRWLKLCGLSMVKNGSGQSNDATLKLIVSEEWTDRINWLFACDQKN